MRYYIVSEKNGDRNLVCASDEAGLQRLLEQQDEDFEIDTYLELTSHTFDRAGFILFEPK